MNNEADDLGQRLSEQHTRLVAIGQRLQLAERSWIRADIMPLDDGEILVRLEATPGDPVGDRGAESSGTRCVGFRAAHAIDLLVDMETAAFDPLRACDTWAGIAGSPMAMSQHLLETVYARVSMTAFRIATETFEERDFPEDIARYRNTHQQAFVAARRALLGLDPFGDSPEPDPDEWPDELDLEAAQQAAAALIRNHRKSARKVRRQIERGERRLHRKTGREKRKPKKH